MKRKCRAAILAGCLLCAAALAGCGLASERSGPFDVPAAVPREKMVVSGTGAGNRGASMGPAGVPGVRGGLDAISPNATDAVRRAAEDIAASTVFFAFNKADLSAEARKTLDGAAALLKRYSCIRVTAHAHCDERGSYEFNYALGERRARVVYEYLARAGVPPRQLEMVNHGEKTPAVAGTTDYAHARNRRTELIITTTCF